MDEVERLPVRVIKRSDFHEHATIAHGWMAITEKYKSMKDAKRAGWGTPMKPGTYRTGTITMRISDA